MNEIKTLNKRITELIQERNSEIEKLVAAIQEKENALAKAQMELIEATTNGNAEKAKEANAMIADCKLYIKTYNGRLSYLDDTTLVSDQEYNEMCNEVKLLFRKDEEKMIKRMVKLYEGLEKVSSEGYENLERCNAVLKMIQGRLYKNKDCTYPNGMTITHKVQKIDYPVYLSCISYALNDLLLDKLTGGKFGKDNNKDKKLFFG